MPEKHFFLKTSIFKNLRKLAEKLLKIAENHKSSKFISQFRPQDQQTSDILFVCLKRFFFGNTLKKNWSGTLGVKISQKLSR